MKSKAALEEGEGEGEGAVDDVEEEEEAVEIFEALDVVLRVVVDTLVVRVATVVLVAGVLLMISGGTDDGGR